jgi:Uma2 family endonuclease
MGDPEMATATPTFTPTFSILADPYVELRGIGWAGYKTVLRLRGDRSRPKMLYLDGDLLLMSPALPHERLKSRLGLFVVEILVGLKIPFLMTGQTTFRRRKKDAGVEPDESYYLANEARVRGKKEIDLRVDPPPDLAIEAVHTHGASMAVETLRRLRVPEVWVCDDDGLRILVLQANRRYTESDRSLAFPFLTGAEILDWTQRPQVASDLEWMEDLRRWVQEELIPRVRDQA